MIDDQDLPAGRFSTWLRTTRRALAHEGVADVPCGACTACCTSSYFVHIGPTETRTLARITPELLFPVPGPGHGDLLLGYDKRGNCPMLAAGKCSIYGDHPLTCRGYDCRVFAAAGIAADRDLITRRARQWRFGYASDDDRDQHAAVRAAARFLRERAECFPGGAVPDSPAQVAILAIKAYEVFLGGDRECGAAGHVSSDAKLAAAVVRANAEFAVG